MTGWIEAEFGLPIASDGMVRVAATIWDGGETTWDGAGTIWDAFWPVLEAHGAGDILIQWDNADALGDWRLAAGDLQTGQDLETACLVSLFTDRLATPDFVPTDGTSDRRGWWADPYNDQPLGSNLWQLERAKKTRDTLGLARRYTEEALQWLVDDGVARSVLVNTAWLGRTGSTLLGIGIAITKPDGSVTRFVYGWAWDGLATLASPVHVPAPAQRMLVR
jgi:phage gp46-like protein